MTAEPDEPQWHRTLAPLHNLSGPSEPIVLQDGVAIRPFTKDEAETLVRRFGDWTRGIDLGGAERGHWTHAAELRWDLAEDPTNGEARAIEAIEDVVRALRLHRQGVVGTTVIWTRPELPNVSDMAQVDEEGLCLQHGPRRYVHSQRYLLTRDDEPGLRELFFAVQAARGTDERLQLALRRFDAAYARYEHEDSLIDLWVAFEALLTSPKRQVSSDRVALRVAWLTRTDEESRNDAYKLARKSFKARSAIVHGDESPENLRQVVEETRELARQALRLWMIKRPESGVEGLDAHLLA